MDEKLPPIHSIKLFDFDDDFNYDLNEPETKPELQIPSSFNPDHLPELMNYQPPNDYQEDQEEYLQKVKEKRKKR